MERFGICILGMGDCTPKITRLTETFTTSISRNLKERIMNINKTTQFMSGATQVFRLKNLRCGGNLNMSNISQKAVMSINYSSLDKAIDENTFKDMQEQAIKQAVESNDEIKTEFMSGGGADINETSKIVSTNIREVRDSYTYNDFKSFINQMKVSQEIDMGNFDIGKDCNINNISQTIQIDIIANEIAEKMSKAFTDLAQKNESSSTAKAQTKIESTGFIGDLGRGIKGIMTGLGLGLVAPLIIGVVGFLLLAGVVIIIMAMKKKSGATASEAGTEMQPFGTPGATDAAVQQLGGMFLGRNNMYGGWA